MAFEHEIPGIPRLNRYIDSADALDRFGGNLQLYVKMLRRFIESPMTPRLLEEIEKKQFAAAAKTAHSIKGAGMNLSLAALAREAETVQNGLAEGRCSEEDLRNCIDCYGKTVEYIEKFIESYS